MNQIILDTMDAQKHPAYANMPFRIGFWSALLNTVGGIVYFAVILASIASGSFQFPPSQGLQLFGGILSLLFCPLLVVMMASVDAMVPPDKQVYSRASLGFTLLFALAVSINRFSQLGVVRQAEVAGRVEGLSWFLAYGDYSIMLGLEYLGWAWFLGLAMLMAAPIFAQGKLEQYIRWFMVLYGMLGLLSSIGFLLGNWLALLGFVAWGLVLFIITGLLSLYFLKKSRSAP